jgi:hypothetical protein
MKARSRFLCEHSLGMALAAIEIYNKPDFKNREQVFAILMVTAWESLLKAKILLDNRNRPSSLWIKEIGGRYKVKADGQKFTIGLTESLRRCGLSAIVVDNVTKLKDVRDAAVHLTAESGALPSLVFALGTAALRNYSRLAREWFSLSFSDYNFFILPLGFSYPFQTLSVADTQKEPEDIARLLASVSKAQQEGRAEDDGFHLVCEIKTTFISSRKVTDATDFVASVKGEGERTIVSERHVNLIDKYPYRFSDLWSKVKAELPGVRQNKLLDVIRESAIKSNPKYARHNYRSKADEKQGPTKATPVIYNEDALRFVIEQLRAQMDVSQ